MNDLWLISLWCLGLAILALGLAAAALTVATGLGVRAAVVWVWGVATVPADPNVRRWRSV